MAQIVTRTARSGAASFQVKWRHKADRSWQTVTLDDVDDAKHLKLAVEVRGHMVRKTDADVLDFSIVTGLDTRSTAPLFGVWAEQHIAGRGRSSEATREQYRRLLRVHVPEWAGRPVDAIETGDVLGVVARIESSGGSARTLTQLLRGIFRAAHARGVITVSPMVGVSVAARGEGDPAFLEPEELEAVRRACTCEVMRDSIDVFVGTGLRFGELMGLQVRDVRRSDGVTRVHIHQAAKEATKEVPRYHIGKLKTKASQRVLVVDESVARVLARHCRGKAAGDLVFPNPTTGGIWTNSSYNSRWGRVIRRAQESGLTVRPRVHDLRHTHAARLLSAGASLFVVSRRLGHANIKVTADTYGHLSRDADNLMVVLLDTLAGANEMGSRSPRRGRGYRARKVGPASARSVRASGRGRRGLAVAA